MTVKVGTFNLNNLFSRFNFTGAIDQIEESDGAAGSLTIRYEFTDPTSIRVRTFLGKLVKAKAQKETEAIAGRIMSMNADVLAVQEVENIDILRQFNRDNLNGLYRYAVLIEGNDPRFIDVGLLSRLPIGAIVSHQAAPDPAVPGEPIFGRDLLEVQVLNTTRTKQLFTIFNTHLKSHFVPYGEDQEQGAITASARRRRQAEAVSEIVGSRLRKDARYLIMGDMNDPPDSADLAPMLTIDGQQMVDALMNPTETRPPKAEADGHDPQTTAWTYRHKPSGQPAEHRLYDQIWLSPALAVKQTAAMIDRRTKHGGDGSDHDPAYIELDL